MCPQVKTIPVLVIRRLWSLNHTVKYISLESGAVGNYPGTGNREFFGDDIRRSWRLAYQLNKGELDLS